MFFLQNFMFSSRFMLFPTFKKKIGVKKFRGGGAIAYWLNGRWFLQIVDIHVGNFSMKLTGRWFHHIVDRDSGNLYPIYIKQKLWCLLLNMLAGDLGRPSCLVLYILPSTIWFTNVHSVSFMISEL